MLRVCAIVLIAYNCGYPGLAGFRPAALDQALSSFHNEVNASIGQALRGAEQLGGKIAVLAENGAERAKREIAGSGTASN